VGYDRLYFLKKAYALYPGVIRPVAAPILMPHYERRRRKRGMVRAVLDAIVGLAFLAWVPWRARAVQRKFALDAGWRRRTVAIARARFADPNDIALFRIDSAGTLDGYVRRYEDAAFNKAINPLGWTPDCALADKARFAERCRAAGLPHPATIALAVDGRVQWFAEPDGRDLVAKPTDGEGGDGVRMLGMIADRATLATVLGSPRGTILVQPRVAVHPALADVALAALPTVRIVTILDERGAPEVVSATVRLPSDPAANVDNMKAGGLLAAVDLVDGTLGLACKGYGGGDYHDHPVTGAAILGRALPDWQACRALVVDAHARAFADYALIGWDVAMTPDGPLLIEGNGKPGVLMPQRAARRGLCETRYGELLAHHLRATSQEAAL
jgi:hypothetical protein